MKSDIAQFLAKSESETLEFKGPGAHLDSLARSVCGMLNQQGGVIIWGVNERRQVPGLANADERAGELNAFLVQHVSPRPLLSVSTQTEEGKQLVVVDVPPGADKPYSFMRQIWVRVGGHTLRADSEASAALVERSAARLDRWEREAMPGFDLSDCDSQELRLTRTEIADAGRFGVAVPNSDEELLRRLYLLRSGQLTNAAVVLYAREPRAWAPNLALRIVTYRSEKHGDIVNDAVFEGPAIRILREAVGTIQQRTGFLLHFDERRLQREDRPSYALFALREGLVNAMVHRDYESLGGAVEVDIFPSLLRIRNAGRLPDGWRTEDLTRKHASVPVNPDIARVFYLRGLMEQLGMGTQRLIAECRKLGARVPVWRIAKGIVELTLFPAPLEAVTAELSDRQAEFLKNSEGWSDFKVGDYARFVKISERQARRDLADLEARGMVERRGKGPATTYRRQDPQLT